MNKLIFQFGEMDLGILLLTNDLLTALKRDVAGRFTYIGRRNITSLDDVKMIRLTMFIKLTVIFMVICFPSI
ncbi:hypothetical protein D3C73_1249750 [compost metagenome]